MKEHVDRLFGKLRSSKGETLAELLVSVLVIVLGLTMFATAMMSSKKMLVKGDAVIVSYRITCNNGNQRTLINP